MLATVYIHNYCIDVFIHVSNICNLTLNIEPLVSPRDRDFAPMKNSKYHYTNSVQMLSNERINIVLTSTTFKLKYAFELEMVMTVLIAREDPKLNCLRDFDIDDVLKAKNESDENFSFNRARCMFYFYYNR